MMIEGVNNKAELEDLIRKASLDAFKEALLSYGIDHRDPIQLQKDFAYIRALRNTADATKKKAWFAIVTLAVTGAASIIWLAIRGGVS